MKTGFPSNDKPWMKYYDSMLAEKIPVTNTSLYRNIYSNNYSNRTDDAIIYFGKRITYGKLFSCIDNIAGVLSGCGLKKGDSIMVCMTGTPETVEIILACSKLGLCVIMVNPTLSLEEISTIINESDSNFIFCMDQLYLSVISNIDINSSIKIVIVPAVFSLPPIFRLVYYLKEPKLFSLNKSFIKGTLIKWHEFINFPTKPFKECIDGNQPLTVVFSSGTTGKAKGIVHTNYSYNSLIKEYMSNKYPFVRQDVFLNNLPSFIAAGLSYSLFVPIYCGITVILEPIYSSESFVSDILKYKPNFIPATKSFWYEAMDHAEFKKADLSFVKIPITGGEPVSAQDENVINSFLKEHNCTRTLFMGWGMSEFNATVTATSIEGNTIGCTGIPLPNIIVSVFDIDSGEECNYNQLGKLRVISPSIMKEYYHNKALTESFFVFDNQNRCWAHTGDIGYINENGEVFVLGRASESVLSSTGRRVYLFEIEKVINENRYVARCKVIKKPDNKSTQTVAHIIFHSDLDLEADGVIDSLRFDCNRSLPNDVCPKEYKVHEVFPVTPNGKIDYHELEKL